MVCIDEEITDIDVEEVREWYKLIGEKQSTMVAFLF
jgi:hypothetical protein